jgi:hypothetical protein
MTDRSRKIINYASGEDICPGDEIVYHGTSPGRVDFVVVEGDAETEWYCQQYGRGVMLVVEGMGNVYETHENALDPGSGCEPLRLVARRAAAE